MPRGAYNSNLPCAAFAMTRHFFIGFLTSSVLPWVHAASCPDKVCVSGTSRESGVTQDFDNTYIKESENLYRHSDGDFELYKVLGKWYFGDKGDSANIQIPHYFKSKAAGTCPVELSYANSDGKSSNLEVKEGECTLMDSMASTVGTVIGLLLSVSCCCSIAFCIYRKCSETSPPAQQRQGQAVTYGRAA